MEPLTEEELEDLKDEIVNLARKLVYPETNGQPVPHEEAVERLGNLFGAVMLYDGINPERISELQKTMKLL